MERQRDAEASIELTRAPPLRCTLLRTGEQTYELLWSTHHVIIDGWSQPLILADVSRLMAGGDRVELEQRPPFRHYIQWLDRWDRDAALRFWRDQVGDVDEPFALTPPDLGAEVSGGGFHRTPVEVDASTMRRLSASLKDAGLTLGTALHGAWARLPSTTAAEAGRRGRGLLEFPDCVQDARPWAVALGMGVLGARARWSGAARPPGPAPDSPYWESTA